MQIPTIIFFVILVLCMPNFVYSTLVASGTSDSGFCGGIEDFCSTCMGYLVMITTFGLGIACLCIVSSAGQMNYLADNDSALALTLLGAITLGGSCLCCVCTIGLREMECCKKGDSSDGAGVINVLQGFAMAIGFVIVAIVGGPFFLFCYACKTIGELRQARRRERDPSTQGVPVHVVERLPDGLNTFNSAATTVCCDFCGMSSTDPTTLFFRQTGGTSIACPECYRTRVPRYGESGQRPFVQDTQARVLYWRRHHGVEVPTSMPHYELMRDNLTIGGPDPRKPQWSLQRGLSFLAPNEYICPISLSVMSDPVKIEQSGISYEREAIATWLRSHPYTDPKTNISHQPVRLTFVTNEALLDEIRTWATAEDQLDSLKALGISRQASAASSSSGLAVDMAEPDAAPAGDDDTAAAAAPADAEDAAMEAEEDEGAPLRRALLEMGMPYEQFASLDMPALRALHAEWLEVTEAAREELEAIAAMPESARDERQRSSAAERRAQTVAAAAGEATSTSDTTTGALGGGGGPPPLIQVRSLSAGNLRASQRNRSSSSSGGLLGGPPQSGGGGGGLRGRLASLGSSSRALQGQTMREERLARFEAGEGIDIEMAAAPVADEAQQPEVVVETSAAERV